MTRGKDICKTLKGIRQQIADANNIRYQPCECHHEGDCFGTCPACEQEIRYIENQLKERSHKGIKHEGYWYCCKYLCHNDALCSLCTRL